MAGLFGSNSSFGVSSLFGNNSSSVLSDWAFIRSGTYKKLMKAYYGQDKTTKSATESAKTNRRKQQQSVSRLRSRQVQQI